MGNNAIKTIFAAIGAALCLFACSGAEVVENTTACVQVRTDSKSDVPQDGMSLMLFNSEGRLVSGGRFDSEAGLRARTGTGYTLVALSHCPDFLSGLPPTLDEVLSSRLDLAEWNDPGEELFASRAVRQIPVLGPEGVSVELELVRFASRAVLREVALADGCGMGEVTLSRVFLSGAGLSRTIGGGTVSSGGGTSAEAPACADIGILLREGSALAPDISLFCYPTDSLSLVLELVWDGNKYYYHADLSSLRENCSCDVSLTVKNPGSTDPERPLGRDELSVGATLSEWAFGKEFNTNLSNQSKL